MHDEQFVDKQGTTGGIHRRYLLAQALMMYEVHLAASREEPFPHVVPPLLAPAPIPPTPPVAAPAPRQQLVQITPPVQAQPRAILPKELTEPYNWFFERCMEGIDKQDEALAVGNPELLKEAHSEIRNSSRLLKKRYCKSYSYPAPLRSEPDRWDVFCDSGRNGKFSRTRATCTQCRFFNANYTPEIRETAAAQSGDEDDTSAMLASIVPPHSRPGQGASRGTNRKRMR
jgi:hypothetical protein